MLFKTEETYVIASPMEGVLMKDGKPLANAKITRKLKWIGNENGISEEFTTDSQGVFSLPIHEETLAIGMLTQFVSSVHITTSINNKSHDIWYNNKFDNAAYTETNGPAINLICDLNAEEVIVRNGLANTMTICRWENMS